MDACKEQKIDFREVLSPYIQSGFFVEFGQSDLLEDEGLFLGFGKISEKMLSRRLLILTSPNFELDDFEEDGYVKQNNIKDII
ncbi:MAG: hypothetical protein MZU97_07635 [Bacillus subtilis]|nr:hypothetical protein [Bacillus subtilis]